jgi:2'-5' RNA ligase
MDKYLVAHILSGTAKKYCERISSELSDKFTITDPHRRIPAHFTLKSPFQANGRQIEEVCKCIQVLTDNHDTENFSLNGFGNFHNRVIYVNGSAENNTRRIIDTPTARLKEIEWIEIGKHDHDITLHATLARVDKDTKFREISHYLQAEYQPDVQAAFDNISILKLDTEKDEWKLYKEFLLT